MGDRANAVVLADWPDDLNPNEAVFLYSHWAGHELPELVRQALIAGEERWNDEPYLARIVFDTITEHQHGGTTGYGISTRIGDNSYNLIVLHKQRVYSCPEDVYNREGFDKVRADELPNISFEAYIEEARNWDNLTASAVVVHS